MDPDPALRRIVRVLDRIQLQTFRKTEFGLHQNVRNSDIKKAIFRDIIIRNLPRNSFPTTFVSFRYSARVGGYPEQLQPLPHQDHPVERDHYGPQLNVRVRLQLHGAGARLHPLPRDLRGRAIFYICFQFRFKKRAKCIKADGFEFF